MYFFGGISALHINFYNSKKLNRRGAVSFWKKFLICPILPLMSDLTPFYGIINKYESAELIDNWMMRSQCLTDAVPVHIDWKMNIWGCSVADPRCLSRNRIFPFRIPGRSRIRIKEFKYFLPKKIVSKLSELWSGMFVHPGDIDFLQKKAPDPGSGSATVIWPVFEHAARGPAYLHGLIGGTGGHPLPVEVVRHIVNQILVVCLQRWTSNAIK